MLNHSLTTYLRERRLKKEGKTAEFEERDRRAKERKIAFPNPLDTLRIIFSKIAGILLLTNGILFCCYYAVAASIPSQFKKNYGLNDLEVSLMFLPFAGGGIFSALTTGRLIDRNFKRHCKRLGVTVVKNRQTDLSNFPIERARLEVALPLVVVGAFALLAYGWVIAEGVSIAAPCVFLFFVGYAITATFNSNSILMIDMYPGKPATATAANNLVRCEMGAGAAALVVPLANAVGFGWTTTICCAIWLLTVPLLLLLLIKGQVWRKQARERLEKKQQAKEAKKQAKTLPNETEELNADHVNSEKNDAEDNNSEKKDTDDQIREAKV
jgi:Major Facilitator Superfamily